MTVPIKISSIRSKHVVRQQVTDPKSGAQMNLDLDPEQAIFLAGLLIKAANYLKGK